MVGLVGAFMKSIFATILIFLGSILHAEENPLGITFFGSFLHTDRVPNALFFFSDIQKNDGFELRRALRTHEIDTIVLASPGGSVWEGLNMAGIIFDKKMTAYVPPLPEGRGCYSACAYMFFAGQTRLAVGELGVHQIGAYDPGVDSEKRKVGETQQATQFTTSEVIGFLNEFGTPPWVYERMFRSREIYVFTEDEKKDLSQGQLDPTIKSSIDGFLVQLRAELEKAEKAEPKTSAAEGFDKTDREMVKALQVLLNEAKCSAGVADGVWGRQTNAAASRFAEANGLKYLGTSSINGDYVERLSSEKRKECPPRQKLNASTIPTENLTYPKYTWSFTIECYHPNRFKSGDTALRFQWGHSTYYNLRPITKGSGRAVALHSEIRFYVADAGVGSIPILKNTHVGKTSKGCRFTSTRN
jgi:hypothetical protein